jgi:peptidylamidoglycolate lyase
MQRTTPAPRNVMPLAIRLIYSSARAATFGYHVMMLGKVASVMPLLGLALPLISGVGRHEAMRIVAVLTICTVLGVLSFETIADDKAESSTAYRVVHGWPAIPEGQVLGWVVSGVGVDSHGDVFVFHRAGREWNSDELDLTPITRPTVLRFDGNTGVLKSSWGENRFAMPHGLTIDEQDNVWLTDVALQQVYKFSQDGKLLLTLGERGVGGNDARHFNRPTKVAVASDGSFYVSDGYRNSRIAKFAPDGRFLMEWGSKGYGAGQFGLPHGIALDKQGRVYVADRANARVQIFDSAGKHITTWKGPEYGAAFRCRGRY